MQKIILLILTIFISYTFTIAQEKKLRESSVPPIVVKKFKSTHSNAILEYWEKEGNNYEVHFTVKDKAHESKYSPEGNWIETESPIELKKIPAKVMAGWNKSIYKDWDIKKILKIETADKKVLYEFEAVKTSTPKEIRFSSEGVIASEQAD
jgi:hypothetical protein